MKIVDREHDKREITSEHIFRKIKHLSAMHFEPLKQFGRPQRGRES